ncbi:MAG: hypothetical protein FWF25_02940 [Propionibacteriaceae bacterium]|nr:hypothetical protein [Propionibacteriaceae bacterium]
MKLRVGETPWGAARFTYSYLAVVLAALVAGVLALIVNPVVKVAPVCRNDQLGFCQPIVTALVSVVIFFLLLFVVAYVLRLGWQWAAWCVALTLVLGEVVVQASNLTVIWFVMFIPALASAISFERPNRDTARWMVLARIVALAVVVVQFVIWMIVLIVSP